MISRPAEALHGCAQLRQSATMQTITSRHSSTPSPADVNPQGSMQTLTASPLARTVAETPTDVWNDSCAVDELEYAVAFGAVGATANPTIVVDVWKKDPDRWAARSASWPPSSRTCRSASWRGDRGRDERPRRPAAPTRRSRRPADGPAGYRSRPIQRCSATRPPW